VLSPDELRSQIRDGRAVQVYYLWNAGTSAHVALIIGFYPNDEFEVFDPSKLYGAGRRAYSEIVGAYGLGQWRLSYFNVGG